MLPDKETDAIAGRRRLNLCPAQQEVVAIVTTERPGDKGERRDREENAGHVQPISDDKDQPQADRDAGGQPEDIVAMQCRAQKQAGC